MITNWLTNNREAATQLRQIDKAEERARRATATMPLAEKIVAMREIKAAKTYDRSGGHSLDRADWSRPAP